MKKILVVLLMVMVVVAVYFIFSAPHRAERLQEHLSYLVI